MAIRMPRKSGRMARSDWLSGIGCGDPPLARPLVLLRGLLVELGAPARRRRDLHVAALDLGQGREQLVAVRRLLRVALHDPYVRDRGAEVEALERAQVAVVVVGRDVQLE